MIRKIEHWVDIVLRNYCNFVGYDSGLWLCFKGESMISWIGFKNTPAKKAGETNME